MHKCLVILEQSANESNEYKAAMNRRQGPDMKFFLDNKVVQLIAVRADVPFRSSKCGIRFEYKIPLFVTYCFYIFPI
jgi:hypothetical protein